MFSTCHSPAIAQTENRGSADVRSNKGEMQGAEAGREGRMAVGAMGLQSGGWQCDLAKAIGIAGVRSLPYSLR